MNPCTNPYSMEDPTMIDIQEEGKDEVVPLPGEEAEAEPDKGAGVAGEEEDGEVESLRGVLFGRSVRASYASLNIAALDDDDDEDEQVEQGGGGKKPSSTSALPKTEPEGEEEPYHVLVRIQFLDNVKELRSYFRRNCKFGDLLKLQGIWKDVDDAVETEWKEPRLIVNVHSVEQAKQAIQVKQLRFWNMTKTQEWQNSYYRLQQQRKARDSEERRKQQQQQQTNKRQQQGNTGNDNDNDIAPQAANKKSKSAQDNAAAHHAGGLAKRKQGEYVATFLVHMIRHKLNNQRNAPSVEDASTWATKKLDSSSSSSSSSEQIAAALRYLNEGGGGVLDVAGGSGHVSMALGLLGIQSTVVDPRENVGKLPGRDRKVWNRALKKTKKRKFDDPVVAAATTTTTTRTSSSGDNSHSRDVTMTDVSTEYTSLTADPPAPTPAPSLPPPPQESPNMADVHSAIHSLPGTDVHSAIHSLPGTNTIEKDSSAIQALPDMAGDNDDDAVPAGTSMSIYALPTTMTVEPVSSVEPLPPSDTTSNNLRSMQTQRHTQASPAPAAAPVPDTIQVPSTVSISATPSEQSAITTTTTNNNNNNDNDNTAGTTMMTMMPYCQPVRQYQTLRAWFGQPPEGVDNTFRNPDDAEVPVCNEQHPLLKDCRAIVALHPDEATDAIVDTAVQLRIPFVVVPCCVFRRLFPHRRMPRTTTGEEQEEQSAMVSTYKDLLDYLQAKDPSIQRATLPFVGANTVLWSTFSS